MAHSAIEKHSHANNLRGANMRYESPDLREDTLKTHNERLNTRLNTRFYTRFRGRTLGLSRRQSQKATYNSQHEKIGASDDGKAHYFSNLLEKKSESGAPAVKHAVRHAVAPTSRGPDRIASARQTTDDWQRACAPAVGRAPATLPNPPGNAGFPRGDQGKWFFLKRRGNAGRMPLAF